MSTLLGYLLITKGGPLKYTPRPVQHTKLFTASIGIHLVHTLKLNMDELIHLLEHYRTSISRLGSGPCNQPLLIRASLFGTYVACSTPRQNHYYCTTRGWKVVRRTVRGSHNFHVQVMHLSVTWIYIDAIETRDSRRIRREVSIEIWQHKFVTIAIETHDAFPYFLLRTKPSYNRDVFFTASPVWSR